MEAVMGKDNRTGSMDVEADSLHDLVTTDNRFIPEETSLLVHSQRHQGSQLTHFLDDRGDGNGLCTEETNSDSKDSRNERNKPFSCTDCDKSFTYLSQYKMHSVIHTGERPFMCTVCSKSFTQYGNLKTHYGVHTGERPHACPVCDRKFRKLGNLKKHHQIHTGDKSYTCTECDEKFTLPSRLKKHLHAHTCESIEEIESQHECTICNKKFTQPNDLRRHILIHTGERPFVCRECGKGFIRSSALREHSRVHTGEKPYACGVCNRQFSNLNNLNLHLRSHCNVCGVCGKRFVSSEKLERHKHVHVGGKLNQRRGGKKCAKHNGVQDQSITQVGDKPYVCTVCNKRFTTASNLNHHSHFHLQEIPSEFSQQLKNLIDVERGSSIYAKRTPGVSKNIVFCMRK
ncbi:zinc finger protein 484 isoform X2 [Cryptotermes secundus]|uniref:zinc finger protein 484 isoform X2 n=1 Tax=Cryptotermes secundus TaxID=105785 RepID=UPI000CD7D42A|nr:zinc finger protein 484 isoform X2 [Cryptotermes secundus]